MENYGFEFRMKEMVLSPFAKMTNAIAKGFDSAEAHNKSFQKGINDTGRLVNSLAAKMRSLEVKKTITLDDKQLKKVESQLDRLKKRHLDLSKTQKSSGFNTPEPTKPSGSGAGGLMGMMSNPYVMGALAGIYTVKQVVGAAGELSNKGYEYERNKFGITQYTGNARVSETYIDKLSKTSTGKMFGSDAVSGFQQAMMGFKDAEKSFEFVTKTLSNISAGTGNKISELAGIQMKTRMQGYVQMDEAQQWSERKIPLLEYLGKATNMNSEKLLKAIEQRKVKTESFDKALLMMTSGKGIFANMTEKASTTGFGQKSGFENTMDLKVQQAGNKFNEMFSNKFYKAGNSFFEALEKQEPKMKSAFDKLSVQLELTNTPLKGFGSNVSSASLAASGFASMLSGVANTFAWFSKKNDEKATEVNKDILWLTQKEEIKKIEARRPSKKMFASDAEQEKYRLNNSSIDQEIKVAERRHLEQNLRFKDSQEEKRLKGIQLQRHATFGEKAEERRNLRKGLNPDGTAKKGARNPDTGTIGKGLGSAVTTGGGVKNITINVSSLINQMQMIKENGKGLDVEQVKIILHEELTATIASAVMMGSGQ